jgi:prophage regulatory protein
MTETDDIEFWTLTEVANFLTLSERTITRMVKAGSFPEPTKLGARRNIWTVEEVKQWLSAKIDARSYPAEREIAVKCPAFECDHTNTVTISSYEVNTMVKSIPFECEKCGKLKDLLLSFEPYIDWC